MSQQPSDSNPRTLRQQLRDVPLAIKLAVGILLTVGLCAVVLLLLQSLDVEVGRIVLTLVLLALFVTATTTASLVRSRHSWNRVLVVVTASVTLGFTVLATWLPVQGDELWRSDLWHRTMLSVWIVFMFAMLYFVSAGFLWIGTGKGDATRSLQFFFAVSSVGLLFFGTILGGVIIVVEGLGRDLEFELGRFIVASLVMSFVLFAVAVVFKINERAQARPAPPQFVNEAPPAAPRPTGYYDPSAGAVPPHMAGSGSGTPAPWAAPPQAPPPHALQHPQGQQWPPAAPQPQNGSAPQQPNPAPPQHPAPPQFPAPTQFPASPQPPAPPQQPTPAPAPAQPNTAQPNTVQPSPEQPHTEQPRPGQ